MVERISRRAGLGPKTGRSVSQRLTTELPGLKGTFVSGCRVWGVNEDKLWKKIETQSKLYSHKNVRHNAAIIIPSMFILQGSGMQKKKFYFIAR